MRISSCSLGWSMDFSVCDRVETKIDLMVAHIEELKRENRGLKRNIYALEQNLNRSVSNAGMNELKGKYRDLVEERDRLIMDRELMGRKVETVLKRLDTVITHEKSRA